MSNMSDEVTLVKPAWLAELEPGCYPDEGPPGGPTVEDEADFGEWAAAVDAREHLDRSDRLTMAGVIDLQVDFYRSWENDVGDLIADTLAELASRIEATGAETPAEFDARNDVLMLP